MIDIMGSICDLLSTIDDLNGHVYRAWPQKRPSGTHAIVICMSRQVEDVAHDGSELCVRLTYSVSLFAPDLSRIDTLTEKVVDLLASYNLHASTTGPTLVDASNLYRTAIILSGSVDVRGNTFS